MTTTTRTSPRRRHRTLARSTVLTALCAFALGAAADDCDTARGELMFGLCQSCHQADRAEHDRSGPHLVGLFGRPAGSAEGFRYSPAMADADVTWTAETLDAFLASPRQFMPGTTMMMAPMRNDADRAALICWLRDVAGTAEENDQ